MGMSMGHWSLGFPMGYVGAGPVLQPCLMFARAISILITPLFSFQEPLLATLNFCSLWAGKVLPPSWDSTVANILVRRCILSALRVREASTGLMSRQAGPSFYCQSPLNINNLLEEWGCGCWVVFSSWSEFLADRWFRKPNLSLTRGSGLLSSIFILNSWGWRPHSKCTAGFLYTLYCPSQPSCHPVLSLSVSGLSVPHNCFPGISFILKVWWADEAWLWWFPVLNAQG